MRPVKSSGIDYFPHDCNHDEDLEYIEAKHGLIGYAIYFKILERIYKKEGYYLQWDEKQTFLLSKKLGIEKEKLVEIVMDMITEQLFDSKMLNRYKILTSQGIQGRYFKVVGKRKKIKFNSDYGLIPEITELIQEKTELIPEETTQSKRERESKRESKSKDIGDNSYPILDFWALWLKKSKDELLPQELPTPIEKKIIRIALEQQNFDFWIPLIENVHKSTKKPKLKFFLDGDFREYEQPIIKKKRGYDPNVFK